MNSDSSLPKAAVSLSEVADMDRDESSIKIKACTNETFKGAEASATETEDGLEDDKNQNTSNGDIDRDESSIKIKSHTNEKSKDAEASATETENGLEDEKNQNPRDGDKLEGKRNHERISDQEKVITISDSSDDNSGKDNCKSAKRKRIKLEDVQNFDILLPNQKNSDGVRQAKTDFYNGFISYRKLIDRTRPIFMERDTPDHRLKIGRWLIDKIQERGGRFLKEDGDGATGNCKVMTADDALDYTVKTFEDPWTAFASFIKENKEDQSLAKSSQESNVDCKLKFSAHEQDMKIATALSSPQSRMSSADTSLTEISSSEQESFAIARKAISESYKSIYASSEPALKEMKTGATAAMPLCPSSSSNLHANSDWNALEQGLEDTASHKSKLVLQSCLRERQVLRAELAENQEILLIRQERLSHLEAEFRLFQDCQMFLRSERWLTEKILHQEAIFENRELLGIQHQRCRRLSTLLQLNERQIFEHQTIIEREKLKMETLLSIRKQGLSFERGAQEKLMHKIIAGQDMEAKTVNVRESIYNGNNKNTKMVLQGQMRKELFAAQQMIGQHLALEDEMKRRAAFEQTSAMEQEIQYRKAMEHAVKRQAAMKQAMEARQLMMSRAGLSQHLSEKMFREASNSSNGIQNASSDVVESMGDIDDTGKEIETGCHQEISETEGKDDKGDVEEVDGSKDIQKISPDVTESINDSYHTRKEIEAGCHLEISTTEVDDDNCELEETDDEFIVI